MRKPPRGLFFAVRDANERDFSLFGSYDVQQRCAILRIIDWKKGQFRGLS
jgi:hypothetical protein